MPRVNKHYKLRRATLKIKISTDLYEDPFDIFGIDAADRLF